jgi:hypothetical protein
MSDDVARPTFSDPAQGPAADPATAAGALVPELDKAPLNPVTDEMRGANAAVVYPATVTRMVLLVSHLMQLTDSADYALWAPLATCEAAMRSLHFDQAQDGQAEHLVALAMCVFNRLGALYSTFLIALLERATKPKGTSMSFPTLPEWLQADTDACYAEAAALLTAEPAPPEPKS